MRTLSLYLTFLLSYVATGQVSTIINREWRLQNVEFAFPAPSAGSYSAPNSVPIVLFLGGTPDNLLTTNVCNTLTTNIVYNPNSGGDYLFHTTNYSLTSLACDPSQTYASFFETIYFGSFWRPNKNYIFSLGSPNTLQVSDYAHTQTAYYHADPLDVNNTELLKPTVSPNPFHDYITIQTSQSGEMCKIMLYNLLGELCMEKDNVLFNEPVNVNFLANGFYVLEIKNGVKISQQKVIKL